MATVGYIIVIEKINSDGTFSGKKFKGYGSFDISDGSFSDSVSYDTTQELINNIIDKASKMGSYSYPVDTIGFMIDIYNYYQKYIKKWIKNNQKDLIYKVSGVTERDDKVYIGMKKVEILGSEVINLQVDNKNILGFDSSLFTSEKIFDDNNQVRDSFVSDMFKYASNKLGNKNDIQNTFSDRIIKRVPNFTNDNSKIDYSFRYELAYLEGGKYFNVSTKTGNKKPISIEQMKKILLLNPIEKRIGYIDYDNMFISGRILVDIIDKWDNECFRGLMHGTDKNNNSRDYLIFITPDKKLKFVNLKNDIIEEPEPYIKIVHLNMSLDKPIDYKNRFYKQS